MADLADAEAFYAGLAELTPNQALDYRRIREALNFKRS